MGLGDAGQAGHPAAIAARECAEAAWQWVLDQVAWDEGGPWVPVSVPLAGASPAAPAAPADRDSIYDGVAGLGLTLAEIRLSRRWTEQEQHLADAIGRRLRARDDTADCSLSDGHAGSLTAVALLDAQSGAGLVDRLAGALTPEGWPSPRFGQPPPPVNDLLLGDAGIVLTLLWHGGEQAERLASAGADALAGRAREAPGGLRWKMHEADRERWMPNYSHGTAGIATALAVAGCRLDRPELVEVARSGGEHLVATGDVGDGGFRLPLQIPTADGYETFSYGWCHGPTGTGNLFGALHLAGVATLGGQPVLEWRDRAAHSLEVSGLPARSRPGFWDNDGRCCGTAGVLDFTLNLAQATAGPVGLDFADRLAGAIVERAIGDEAHPPWRYWRFREHRNDPPDLDPGVGWMQGAAGIVAALMRYARVREGGLSATALALPDTWWMSPTSTPPAAAVTDP